jgi:hypothetical protein
VLKIVKFKKDICVVRKLLLKKVHFRGLFVFTTKLDKDAVNTNFPESVRGELVEPHCPSTSSGRTVSLEKGKLLLAIS